MCSGSKVGHSSVAGHEVTEDRQLTLFMLPIHGVSGYSLRDTKQPHEISDVNECMYVRSERRSSEWPVLSDVSAGIPPQAFLPELLTPPG